MTSVNFASTSRRGPFQSVPKPAHKPSSSLSSITSSFTGSFNSHSRSGSQEATAQDVVARILAQDEIPRGTFLASEAQKKKQTHSNTKPYPERIDSRRAMLSIFNGSKAPIVFKGPSFGTRDTETNAKFPCNAAITAHDTAAAGPYMLKDLPPTPKTAPSPGPVSPPAKPSLVAVDGMPNVLPSIRPLNLNIKRSPAKPTATPSTSCIQTLASKRLSRAVRAVPAPIRPPPRLRGIAALNGPCSANTSHEEEVGSEALNTRTTRVPPGKGKEDVPPLPASETPFGDLPVSAAELDIPVDWDELHECWTSPVVLPGEDDGNGEFVGFGLGVDDELALHHFQEEVAGLFASTPKESIAESGEQVDLESPTSSSSPSSDESVLTREKRHGRVLVTKKLKLRTDASVQFGKSPRSHRTNPGPQYGESFLMMYSPLTPCSVGARASSLFDAYAYVS